MPGPLNAIAYGQFKLRGGMKNMLLTGFGYGIAVTLLIMLTLRASDAPARALGGWMSGLLVLQMLALLMFGCGTVSAAIRTDVQGNMIESHRLMPIAPGFAVAGYLLGAPVQALSLAAANFVIGLFVCMATSSPIEGWVIANAMMLAYALFLWVVQIFTGFQTKNAFGVMFLVLLIVTVSQGILIIVLPGLTVLASPVAAAGIFRRTVGTELTWPLAVSFVAQLLVGAICYAGAARRYRRSDVPALGTLLSLLLLGAWAAVSVVGLKYYDEFVPDSMFRGMGVKPHAQVVATVLATMLLALIPLANGARAWNEHLIRRAAGDRRVPAPGLVPPVAVALCLLLALGTCAASFDILSGSGRRVMPPAAPLLALCAVVLLSFFTSATCLFRVVYRRGFRVIWPLMLFLLLTWVGPVVADYARYAMSELEEPPALTALSNAGPVGSMIFAWSHGRIYWFGALLQVALAVGVLILDLQDAGRWKQTHFSTGFPASPQALIPPSRL